MTLDIHTLEAIRREVVKLVSNYEKANMLTMKEEAVDETNYGVALIHVLDMIKAKIAATDLELEEQYQAQAEAEEESSKLLEEENHEVNKVS